MYRFPTWKKIPRWMRVIIYILFTLILLMIILFGVASWYINSHKKELLATLSEQVKEHMNAGNLEIRDIDVAFWKTFPSMSIWLKGVTLSDSMYHQHGRNLVDIKDVYVKIKPLSLLGKQPEAGRIIVANGVVYMFKDTSSYSNLSVFYSGKKPKKKQDKGLQVIDYTLHNVQFTFDNFYRNKKFEIDINDMKGGVKTEGQDLLISADVDVLIGQLGFNLAKGGFLTNTTVTGHLELIYHKDRNELDILEKKVVANDMPVYLSGRFNFEKSDSRYTLFIKGDKVDFSKGRAMLSRHIAGKLKDVEITRPVSLTASVEGYLRYPDIPKINITYTLKQNVIQLPVGDITKADVKGIFKNQFIDTLDQSDANSVVYIYKMKGEFEGVPVVLDSSYVLDLIHPKIFCQIKSTFPVEKLDDLAGASFNLKKGMADLNVLYAGPLGQQDTFPKTINGYIRIKDASLTYLPRNLKFDNCNASLEFNGQDVIFKTVDLSSKSSSLHMDGIGKRFLSAYFNDRLKSEFDLNITSKAINLDEFRSFLAARKSGSNTDIKVKFRQLNNRMDKALALSDMKLNIKVDKVNYRKFTASNIRAKMDLLATGLALKDVHVNHAQGTIAINGAIDQNRPNNPFNVKVNINQVNVTELFRSFENFGMESLTAANIKGVFNGDVDINGGFDDNGTFLSKSLRGKVKFRLANGELNNFAPLMQVQKYAFKNRNLEHVQFKEIANTFDIDRGMVTIHPMEIISSAIYLKVQGVYGIDTGTDIFIEAPLRNPKKDEALIAKGKEAQRTRGLVIYLRAKDDGTGKVKLSWDPTKTGLRENEQRRLERGEDIEEDEEPAEEPKKERRGWFGKKRKAS